LTDEWLTDGIFAADAAVIAGFDTSKTIKRMMTEKKKPKSGFMIARDRDFYPRAKAYYEIMFNVDLKPFRVELEDDPRLKDVIDGKHGDKIAFIKIVGEKTVEANQIPTKYVAQAQYKMALCSANYCILLLSNGYKHKAHMITRSDKMIKRIFLQTLEFLHCLD
jgi:hypothetical protein